MSKSIAAKPKKRGRPATGKDPMIGFRSAPEFTARIDAWAAAQPDAPPRSEAIRLLIEIGLAGGSRSIPLLAATGDAAAAPDPAASSTASEMAGHQIDKLGDASATAEERKTRKQRLLKGPSEFRDIRIDHPSTEPTRASKPPAGAKTASGKKARLKQR
jgi:hypothetical protein